MKLLCVREPFPHLIGSLDEELYQQVCDSWNAISHNNYSEIAGNRSNIQLLDKEIRSKLMGILLDANEFFYTTLLDSYPKLIDHEMHLENRILYSENKATDYDYKIRGLHLDTGDKILVGLWYFKDENETGANGGDLVLYNPLTKKTKTVEYGRNVFVLFPNIPTSWHLVTPRKACQYPRRYVNLLLESKNTRLHNYQRTGTSVDSEFRGKLVTYYK